MAFMLSFLAGTVLYILEYLRTLYPYRACGRLRRLLHSNQTIDLEDNAEDTLLYFHDFQIKGGMIGIVLYYTLVRSTV